MARLASRSPRAGDQASIGCRVTKRVKPASAARFASRAYRVHTASRPGRPLVGSAASAAARTRLDDQARRRAGESGSASSAQPAVMTNGVAMRNSLWPTSFHQRSPRVAQRTPGRLSRAKSAPEIVRVLAVNPWLVPGDGASVARARGAKTIRPPARLARSEISRSSAAPAQAVASTPAARTAYRAPSAPAMEPLALSRERIQRSYRQ